MCTLAIKHLPTVPSMWYTCKAHGSWTLVLKAEGEEARSPCLLDCAQLHPTVRQTYLKLDFSTTLYSVKFLVTPSHLLHTKNVLLKELFIFLVIWIYSFIRYICTQRIDLIHFWKKKSCGAISDAFNQSPKPLRPMKGWLIFLLLNKWNFPVSTMPMLAWTLAFVNKNIFPEIALILKAGVWVQFLL